MALAELSWRQLLERLETLRQSQTGSVVESERVALELEIRKVELEVQTRELRQSQETLEDWRARYAELYEVAEAAYATIDASGVVVEANRAACAFLGRSRSELVGGPFADAAGLVDAGSFFTYLRECLQARRRVVVDLPRVAPGGEQGVLRLATKVEIAPYGESLTYHLAITPIEDVEPAPASGVAASGQNVPLTKAPPPPGSGAGASATDADGDAACGAVK
jgi:PAS domain S-box-containing protein